MLLSLLQESENNETMTKWSPSRPDAELERLASLLADVLEDVWDRGQCADCGGTAVVAS